MVEDKKAQLLKEYLDTDYVAEDGSERYVARIGEPNAELDELLKRKGHSEWAFITAYNPYSKQLSDRENEDRQLGLFKRLEGLDLLFLKGYGKSATGAWPPEPSVLVLGLDRETAVTIAREYEQNAIVCGRINKGPELVWCQD